MDGQLVLEEIRALRDEHREDMREIRSQIRVIEEFRAAQLAISAQKRRQVSRMDIYIPMLISNVVTLTIAGYLFH